MKKLIYLSILCNLFLSISSFTQEIEYSFLSIPANLKEDANAVIRNSATEITIEDVDKMIVHQKVVVTVLNKLGNNYAAMYEGYDNDTKITKLSAYIYNGFGKQIKKYKERDFLDVSAVDGGTLYSDSRVKYVDYTPISYPYTVVFESEYKTSSTAFIPRWFPTNGYLLGVEKSSFKLNNPLEINIRTKKKNFKNFSIQDLSSGNNLHFILENQPAFKPEAQTINIKDFMPNLTVGLDKFTVKNIAGEASNWKELGKWEYDVLYQDEDNISEKTKEKIKSLVANIKDPIEKAKIVYEYVQNKTRYINVSIGIGGLRPMRSEVVDRLGYGDCKGLTNYTRALLKVVGVESYFTELYAGKTKLNMDFDFPVIHGNHVILNIPNNGEDVWLECTSQITPFGFLGDFTDDRDVIVVTPEGAVKKRTPAYLNQDNLQKIKGVIELNFDGGVKAKVERVSKGIQFDDKFVYSTFNNEELIKYYKSDVWSYVNNLEIESVKLTLDKKNIVFTEDLNFLIKNYATVNENEYLLKVNIFNRESYVPKRYRKRKLPLKISRGYKDVDEYEFKLPKGYVLGVLPPVKELSTKFGIYKVSFEKINDTSFKYYKSILIKEGTYPKEDYKLYRSFRRSIAKYENLRIAITKKI